MATLSEGIHVVHITQFSMSICQNLSDAGEKMESPRKESRWRHLRFHGQRTPPTATTPVPSSATTASTSNTTSSTTTTTAAVLKQGFLLKKGHRLPTTKQRFFVLRPQLLSYFRAKHSATDADTSSDAVAIDARHLRGVIQLAPSDLITPIATSRHWFILQKLSGPDGKSYKLELRDSFGVCWFAASSPEERQQWIDALRSAARDPPAAAHPAQSALLAERERQLTRTLTLLHVRDASLLSTVLRQQQQQSTSSTSTTTTTTTTRTPSVVDLRASFQAFHELVLLQSLVTQIQNNAWGAPSEWSCSQYDQLVDSLALAQLHTAPSSSLTHPDSGKPDKTSVLSVARALKYVFEEVPANQQKLLARQEELSSSPSSIASRRPSSSLYDSFAAEPQGRVRCPTIYSYLSTFERLTVGGDSVSDLTRFSSDSQLSSSTTSSARSSYTSNGQPLSPRSATLAKYASLYLEEENRQRCSPWSYVRADDDDLSGSTATVTATSTTAPAMAMAMAQQLVARFSQNRVYASLRHHTLVFVNPNRMLTTSKSTSIYDEQIVLVYAQTPFATSQLAPHPFAMAKQALWRLFFTRSVQSQSLLLSGDSGSGKTELSKELLKYVVLTAQPPLQRSHKVVVYTSSTMSTLQMRHDESRTLDLLHAKGITDYDVVLLDLEPPQRWHDMTTVSKSKRLPQVHIGGLFFGFYETLQRLEDEQQLRMYLQNPHVAKKLSAVLDSNILLEAFAHAATPLNGNSSRYAKSVEIQVGFGRDASQYQVRGCVLSPFLLEKSRVTSRHQRNFHVLYALVHGLTTSTSSSSSSTNSHGSAVAVAPQCATWARDLHVAGCTSESFRYLATSSDSGSGHGSGTDPSEPPADRAFEWKKNQDADRLQTILMAMETVGMAIEQQQTIFRVLSAVLWLGNLDLQSSGGDASVEMAGVYAIPNSTTTMPIPVVLQELLALDSVDILQSLLLRRHVEMKATSEVFDVQLSVSQALHARDTFARSLYQMAFGYVVSHLNHATRCDLQSEDAENENKIRTLRIVDLFGFENNVVDDGSGNSLEQLCINYLTEKVAAVEQQLRIATTAYSSIQSSSASTDVATVGVVLALFEHPLGIFATLEEQTVLHQSETVVSASSIKGDRDAADAQKKNDVFVRYLYQRNRTRLLPQPSQLQQQQLLFVVPHARAVVTYDASDFVAKNSDFQAQQWTLLQQLETATQHAGIRTMAKEMQQQQQQALPGVTRSAGSGSGSLTSQFRTQIQQQANLLLRETAGPLFLHCLKPSDATAYAREADVETLRRQLVAQRLDGNATAIAQAQTSDDSYELSVDAALFTARYQCLISSGGKCTHNQSLFEALDEQLRSVLDLGDLQCKSLFAVESDVVRVHSLQVSETLELLRAKRQFEAAVRIQSHVRMVRAWKWYHAVQADRRALTQELLALYGSSATNSDSSSITRKVERTLRKYQGKEHELLIKIENKKQEKQAIAEISAGMESFLAQVASSGGSSSSGFLDPELLDSVLRDPEIQRLLAANDRIVVALREMSLNPHHVLPKQLEDPQLRTFYQRMLSLLQTSLAEQQIQIQNQNQIQNQPQNQNQNETRNQLKGASLEDRVRALVATHKTLWHEMAQQQQDTQDAWTAICDQLNEIGDEPEMLLFYADDNAVVEAIITFVEAVEHSVESGGATDGGGRGGRRTTDSEEATDGSLLPLLAKLKLVEFNATLMAAMQGDAYCVEALQSPQLVAAVHQLMTDREAFAKAEGNLKSPLLVEFFTRLVRLSEETKRLQ